MMLDNWKKSFINYYLAMPQPQRSRFFKHMLIQFVLSMVLLWMTMKSAKQGWFLFFLVWTAIDMILLQWMREADKQPPRS
ncbi:hypothetical protein [Parvibium lacunae]|uniref:Uncharacterized protein n=1 Tax=Parvibium lacunae TaxID=1888893 RepID=A0A368L7Y1_9BURK|nr:hypothetical protein [Parvibium lacunae]RCS59775.1 hypothetical protein DU000_03460 [Parvibium lacunae]